MKKARLIIQPLLIVVACTFVTQAFSQKTDLKQAIKHYQSKNLGLAEKEIEIATSTPFESVSESAQAMFYFFMIKSELYGKKIAMSENPEEFNKMDDALRSCLENDSDGRFSFRIRERATEIGDVLLEHANDLYDEKNYLKYFYFVEHFIDIKEALGDNCGAYYQALANDAGKTGYNPLQIKYWREMIKSDFETLEAYQSLITSFYSMKMFDQVDDLLDDARQIFPKAFEFERIEILRLTDDGMKFSALKKSKELTSKNSKNPEAFFLQGQLNLQMNHHNEALQCFRRVVELKENHLGATLELGKYYYRFGSEAGNLSMARTFFEKALKLNPDDTVANEFLQDVYMKLAKNKQASVLTK